MAPARWGRRTASLLTLVTLLGAAGCSRFGGREESDAARPPVPVEVAPVGRRALEVVRTFSGAVEPKTRVVVAPKVPGRVERLTVDLADPVERGQVVAYLDAAEFAQAVNQVEAELAVARAELRQAENALEISRREDKRIQELRERGIASDAEYDVAQADLLQKEGQIEVAHAEVRRAAALLESARIRHGYTRVTADWSEGDAMRRVAETYVDEGQTVSANEPLLLIVQLDPAVAVITVTERDYGRLRPGLEARVATDAVPGRTFVGRIDRIAPVFQTTSRQARVEIALPNPDGALKPGMFLRADITLDRIEDALVVPDAALTRRGDADGVFLVDDAGTRAAWRAVRVGVQAGSWVQLLEADLTGRVVTLGQHLLDDGSPVAIAEPLKPAP